MNPWFIVDCREDLDEDQEHPRTVVQTEDQLRAELHRQSQKRPGSAGLISPDDEMIGLSIGGPFAGFGWVPSPPHRQSVGERIAVTKTLWSNSPITFIAEGIPVSIEPNELFPIDEVIEAVVYFFIHHRLPSWIAWREWDPATLKWEIHQPTGVPPGVLQPTGS